MCPKVYPATGRPEILIVEDNPTQITELKLILEQYGFHISVVTNGREALNWLLLSKPTSLVISEIVIPELDGYELCRAVRENERLRHVPFILLGNLSDAEDILKGLESGASNFIVKPFNTDYLISYIRKILSGKHQGLEEHLHVPFALEYGGKEYVISSSVQRIVDVLLATHGTAVRKNEELLKAETHLRLLNEHLKEKIRERTAALTAEIAERHRVEERLSKKSEELAAYSAKLEQSNRDLQDFASVASHDLQEPLRKVQAFGDLLEEEYEAALEEEGREYIHRMQNATLRMRKLIDALLQYSRARSIDLPFQKVALREVVQNVMVDMEVQIKNEDARLEIGELPTIEADRIQMRQLFQNLLGNALKYRGVKIPVIRVYAEPCGCEGFHVIRVEDNGIGFDERYVDKIFKPFQRLHGKSARYDGTGMGLAICRRIVERHGGSITARSAPDSGAVFMVRLPEKQ
jgi:signal transduction histidine kinase/ActR/RegA family two-component response regulator